MGLRCANINRRSEHFPSLLYCDVLTFMKMMKTYLSGKNSPSCFPPCQSPMNNFSFRVTNYFQWMPHLGRLFIQGQCHPSLTLITYLTSGAL